MEAKDVGAVFAESVKRLMDERGWKQEDLAEKLGTYQGNVSRTLTGKRAPSATTIAQYATAFGVDVCDLFCGPKKRK